MFNTGYSPSVSTRKKQGLLFWTAYSNNHYLHFVYCWSIITEYFIRERDQVESKEGMSWLFEKLLLTFLCLCLQFAELNFATMISVPMSAKRNTLYWNMMMNFTQTLRFMKVCSTKCSLGQHLFYKSIIYCILFCEAFSKTSARVSQITLPLARPKWHR